MKTLFATFQRSLYDPAFYREVSKAPFKEGLQYYIKATVALSLFATLAFAILLVPQGVQFVKEDAKVLVEKYYPAHLEVTIEKGEASINSPEPYFIPGSRETLDALPQDGALENILVIDTRSDFEKAVFDEYKTFALLTKHDFVTREEGGRVVMQDLSGVPSMTVSMASLLGFVDRVHGSLYAIIFLGILAMFIILGVGYLFYLIPLVLFALIPFLLAWMKGVALTYSEAYRMSVYAVMPGLVIKTFFNIGGYFFVPAYLSLLVFTLVIFVNTRGMEKN